MTPSSLPYNPALDGLRALSILVVIAFHCFVPGFGGGHLGVDLFFVLSGYLITALLAAEIRHGGIAVGRFYMRRLMRLYPPLLALVLAYLLLAPWLFPNEPRWLMAGLTLTYVMDYAIAFNVLPPTLGVTWSLGVEEKFYLLWPLLLPALLRARRPMLWLLGAFVAVTAWRYAVAWQWGWGQAYFRFDTRVTGIVLGAIAALRPTVMPRWLVLVACASLLINLVMPSLPFHWQFPGATWRVTAAELAAFVLVSHAAAHPTGTWLSSPPLAWLGRLSYGLFLWHFAAISALGRSHSPWVLLGASLTFSLVMAAVCHYLIERPVGRWSRRRFGPLNPSSKVLSP
ncbi:acyltransferase family protein [Roseateles sp. So40a]|uniref:acyltransferase family protein n=1 Tax=Roseateles sp. So40a TaxID=3400226 RepID=UPI003A8C0D59